RWLVFQENQSVLDGGRDGFFEFLHVDGVLASGCPVWPSGSSGRSGQAFRGLSLSCGVLWVSERRYSYGEFRADADGVCYGCLCFRWFLTWVIHLFEALFALKVCSDKGIDSTSTRLLWIAQTFLFGLTSLCLLIKYKPDGRPKRQ
uniref:Transmembrane protein 254 n=1 Tax=Sinocyclocheilus rhinocerous TaxID=307959 RepID=A0A673IFG9_9TELE